MRSASTLNIQYHGVRFSTTGYRHLIEVHLLFPSVTQWARRTHWRQRWKNGCREEIGMPAEVITHLESLEDHADVHHSQHYTGKPE